MYSSHTRKIFENLKVINEQRQNEDQNEILQSEQLNNGASSINLEECTWYDELGQQIVISTNMVPFDVDIVQEPNVDGSVLIEIANSLNSEAENHLISSTEVIEESLSQSDNALIGKSSPLPDEPENHLITCPEGAEEPLPENVYTEIVNPLIDEAVPSTEGIEQELPSSSLENTTGLISIPSVNRKSLEAESDKGTLSSSSIEDSHSDQSDSSYSDSPKTRKRKRLPAKKEWSDFKNKKLRQQGKSYVGWSRPGGGSAKRGTPREERRIGPRCTSSLCQKSKVRKCNVLSEEIRAQLFNKFWSTMNWDQRKIYISSLVQKSVKARSTKVSGEKSRRTGSLRYTIKDTDGQVLPVCKKFFLSTFGLKEWMVSHWARSDTGIHPSQEVLNESKREKRSRGSMKEVDVAKNLLIEFLDSLPKLPSHYCRQSTNKHYVEPIYGSSMSAVYREYISKCKEKSPQIKPVCRYTFDYVIKEKNISFQQPKKDKCDTCCAFETQNIDNDTYNIHIQKKEMARQEKANDKTLGEENKLIVLTQDVQAVKVCPYLNASALYYKTKLVCHNFTIFNVNTHHCRCYWFNETEADLTANTFASCIVDYILDLGNVSKPVVIWSDGCGYQNKNAVLANALLSLSVYKNITIYQKFLEKGHTQMEADSVHALIERNLKNKSIYLPSDYHRITRDARQKNPYEVKNISPDFVKNYGHSQKFESIRPGKKINDPTVNDIKSIKYTPDGNIQVKLNFDEDFQNLPGRKKDKPVPDLRSFPQIRKGPIKIKKQKWDHLQQLKSVIPRDCHDFYDNLPHLQE